MSGKVLILGGTAEARALAAELHDDGTPVISSLAGRVARPRLPEGDVRIGGFGGADKLADWLREHDIAAVVDATHPFAERISASAAQAAPAAQIPIVRLERPGWTAQPGDDWRRVNDLDEAAAAITEDRVFLTSGRQGLPAFAGLARPWFLIRCVDPPEPPLPPKHQVLLDRGPYDLEGERALMERHGIEVLVTKDSGGDHTAPKLQAARERGIPVIVVDRPARPDMPIVTTVDAARAWLS
ncbi:MAG: cobalt-precorrin-6A reductase [Solirubrobacteraceae bacterium]|nr:cobalt-precorrin-6A reductase [Solirubrobacteraceae bacterium]